MGCEWVWAAQRHFGRSCIDGSCAAGFDLDDLTGMSDQDTAVVPGDPTYEGPLYYKYDDDSGLAESLPGIVDPDEAGNGRWILQKLPIQAGGTGTAVGITLDSVIDPGASKTFNMGTYGLKFDWAVDDPPAVTRIHIESDALKTDTDV
jgi:hypothetical protein